MWHLAALLAIAVVGIGACAFLGHLTIAGGPAWPFVKLLLVFALMVLLLRRNVPVGLALLAGTVALAAAFRLPIAKLGHSLSFGLLDAGSTTLHSLGQKALLLALMVFLINFLGQVLIVGGRVRVLAQALERLFRDVRWVVAAVPAVIGLLPMPGGAMLSAPMVDGISDRVKLNPAQKTLTNLWFRHVWEWWWPLFPAILIVVGDGYITMPQVLIYQGPFTVGAIVLGWWFLLRRMERPRVDSSGMRIFHEVARVFGVLWPVLLVVASVMVVRPPEPYRGLVLPAALVAVDVALVLITRLPRTELLHALRRAGQWQIFLLVFGVYVLRGVFGLSGAAQKLPDALAAFHVPVIAACFLVPFVINLITGYNLAGVSMAFPLLVALFAETGPAGVAVAYAGAFLGVLASPVHLCLALTREYFHAEWGRVYAMLLPMLAGMLLIAVVIGLTGTVRPVSDRAFSDLNLTDEQARRIEDWAEVGRFPEDDGDWAGFHKAQAAFMRSVLNDEQWRQYQASPASPGLTCINPWCPCHGRIVTAARVMGWIRRHLPPGWTLQLDLREEGRAGVATGRKEPASPGEDAMTFHLCVCKSDSPLPDEVHRLGMKDLGKGAWTWRAFAVVKAAPPAETSKLLSLFRQACVIDYGRVRNGLHAQLRNTTDPFADSPPGPRKVGKPIELLFSVTNVGNPTGDMTPGRPYVGTEKPPPYLRIQVVTPSGVTHTLRSAVTQRATSSPPGLLGWGQSRRRTVDLMNYAGARKVFAKAGAYKVTATYFRLWPNVNLRLLTNTVTIVLEELD